MTHVEPAPRGTGGVRGFASRGGFWRFLALLIVYLAIYLGAGRISALVAGHFATDELTSSVGAIFWQLTFPLLVGAVVLLAAAAYLGWIGGLFARQPIYRSWWMWIAPAVVIAPILLRVVGIDWAGYGVGVSAFMLATGLLVGFVEELAYRGFGVKMLRDGGHREWVVAALTSLIFGLSHGLNLLSGAAVATVAATVVYTIGFGILMYLSLRAIGFLAGAMILHGFTDPTTFLATGGVDKVGNGHTINSLSTAAGFFTFAGTAIAFILLMFIRGHATPRPTPQAADTP